MTLFRTDRRAALAPLAAPKAAVHFEGRVARVHTPEDPLQYNTGPEYRRADEVQRIVDQLVGIKVTMHHPKGLLSQGAEARVIGTVIAARMDGEYAVAVIALDDETAIEEVKSGIQQLSLGYQCNLDADRYQVGIQLDHLAVVPAARCGESCALRADEATWSEADYHCPGCQCNDRKDGVTAAAIADGVWNDAMSKMPTKKAAEGDEECPCQGSKPASESRHETCTCKTDANCYSDAYMDELKNQLAAAIADAAAEKVRADAAEKRANEEKVRADSAVALATQAEIERDNAKRELAAETARADAAVEQAKADAEKARQDAAASTASAVAARVKLLTEANKVLGETEDRMAMADRDIKVAVIKHVDGDDVPADKPDLYVDGIYDGALKRHAKGAGSRADTVVAIHQMRQDGAAAVVAAADPMAGEKAAQAALARAMSTAWMQKTQE